VGRGRLLKPTKAGRRKGTGAWAVTAGITKTICLGVLLTDGVGIEKTGGMTKSIVTQEGGKQKKIRRSEGARRKK